MDLYQAAKAGDLDRVQVLVEQGADKDELNNLYGRTPLNVASQHGHLRVVRYLVEQGADMEKASGGWTPLVHASSKGQLEVVRYLLEQGANRDKTSLDGWTPLHLVAHQGHLEVAKLLMIYGADLNARDNHRRLPIDMTDNKEIRQAIRDEPRRRMEEAPGKRATEQDRHPNASASTEEKGDEGVEAEEGNIAEEDEDSEPSSDEEDDRIM